MQHKTASVPAHKLRGAAAASMEGLRTAGAGHAAEVGGACFGGHARPENRAGRRLAGNKADYHRMVEAGIPDEDSRVDWSGGRSSIWRLSVLLISA